MAFVSPSDKTTGDVVTANHWNQDVVANVQAGVPDIFTTAGDMVYATGADVAARLGIEQNKVLMGGATAPIWTIGPLTANVMGGVGLSPLHVEAGEVTTDSNGYATITFTDSFSSAPRVWLELISNDDSQGSVVKWVKTISTTQATIACFAGATPQNSKTIMWLAHGADA